jgi:hypothetical protein
MHILVFTFLIEGMSTKDLGTDVCKHATNLNYFKYLHKRKFCFKELRPEIL